MRIFALMAIFAVSNVVLSDQIQTGKDGKVPSPHTFTHLQQARRISLEKQQKLVKEGVEAVMGTENALKSLNGNNTKESLHDLAEVSAKLQLISSRGNKLKLLPVSFQEETFIFPGTLNDVKVTANKAMQLIGEERLQEARGLLNELRSEIRINTVSLPLDEYPAAIQKAKTLIDSGKIEDAKKTLAELLDTLVADIEIYPLPVLSAEADLMDAYELEHKTGTPKEESKKKVLQLTESAENQLKLAEALGYGDKNTYKALYTKIQNLRDTLHTDKFNTAWEDVKGLIGHLNPPSRR